MGTGGGLGLTPAQRNLVEKSRAVQQQRAAAATAQHAIEAATTAHVREVKARCQARQTSSIGGRERRLILRHVGEELARVAQKERLVPAKIRSAPNASNNRKAAGGSAEGERTDQQPQRPASTDDGYDEERYGSERRLPRKQPPNLWVPRKRLAAAAAYRAQLAQQEAEKQRKRLAEQATADTFARAQETQQLRWREEEKAKQRHRQDLVALEAQRWQQALRAQAESQRTAQEKKERNERIALERFQLLIEDDKRRKAERKAADKAEVALVKQANARQLELKRQTILCEQQADVELQKAYEKKLEMQEAARQAELSAILAKQSQKVKLALLNVKSADEKAREDEQRALVVQAAVRAREAELLVQKERRKREGARVQVQALTLQKQEKRQQKLTLAQEETAYACEFKADFQTWQQQEVAKKQQVQQRNRDFQKLVRQQMSQDAARKADEDKYGMTLAEAELNAALLQKAGVASPPKDMHLR
ncbi:hypothetical protein BBJ28_00010712 [Nothophytophthora sp. Chile5]|nr:hypothetical protein BBJ28_00010712 [Nothophytophthora sp. Chile5]